MTADADRMEPAITQALTAAQRADNTDDAAAVQRVRSRLMQRVAADSVRHHIALPGGDEGWHRFLPGIDRKVLHEQDGVMSYLLRFAPGAVLPAHRHPIDEECVVLQGVLRIGTIELGPGGFHRVARDVLDADSTTDEGTIIYLRGASPKAEHLV
jgi:quercetin dioxygenase-like cupin family protein